MIFKIKPQDPHAWKTKFAFLPKKMPGYWFWLERYREKLIHHNNVLFRKGREHGGLRACWCSDWVIPLFGRGLEKDMNQYLRDDDNIRNQIYRWERDDDTVRLIRENFPVETRERPTQPFGFFQTGVTTTAAITEDDYRNAVVNVFRET